MGERVGVDFLRGIVMRAPNAIETKAKAKAFYVESWGLRVLEETDELVLFRGSGPEQFVYGLKRSDSYGIDYINLGVSSSQRVDLMFDRLVRDGVRLLGRPGPVTTPGGGYGFELLDPDNRRVRIVADVARHLDAADEIDRPRAVTHVVLNTPQLQRLQAFYVDRLGFRVSDFSANQMVFLRCGSDHHAIALNHGDYPSVNHVAFEMSSIDAFMRGIGRMKAKGQAPAWGPGRHGPGNNPFGYFVSPSGFVIEFTCEVQQIDEATHEPQVWPRNVPEKMDVWMTAGPPTPAMRTVMAGRPDAGQPLP
jgi:catechol 2,3-dioxygenase-like lactoylglutathione lyase family enzyme